MNKIQYTLGCTLLLVWSWGNVLAQLPSKDQFINDLLAKMTLEEKVGQMSLFTSDWDVTGPSLRPQYK